MSSIKNEYIRVLLVDDSPLILALLKRMLSVPGSGIRVVGTAIDGAEALNKIAKLDPQVICTDLQMPLMDGLEFTRKVMATCPRPILVLSSAVEQGKKDDNSFQLLEAGAIDILPKPKGSISGNLAEVGKELIAKIRLLSGVKTFTRRSNSATNRSPNPSSAPVPPTASSLSTHPTPPQERSVASTLIPNTTRVIAIGASTGGPHALHTILSGLSSKLSVPVICFQHVSAGFTQDLVGWLDMTCSLNVRIAREGERLTPGTVYFPPDGKHLVLDASGYATTEAGRLGVALSHRPSITLGFNSIAQYYRSSVVGILLTGMGADGADGLLNIRKAGGLTIAQDESSCVVFGMPKVAAEIGAAQHVLSLEQIAKILGKNI
jgi:two-component system chemotaxis response regulator CheB